MVGIKVQHLVLKLPFPCTEVNNNEALVLVSVDVVEHANGSPFELVIDVLSWVFPGDVKQGLQNKHWNRYHEISRLENWESIIQFYSWFLLLELRWTQSSPCSWSLGCSKRSRTSAGWFSPGSPQRQSSCPTCRSWKYERRERQNSLRQHLITPSGSLTEILWGWNLHTPVHIGGLEPLSTGELHHHLGLLNGIRFI